MSMSDPIADMLTRIRNANTAKHDTVDVPASKVKEAIAKILLDEGYIKAYEILENGIEKVHRDTFHASLGLGRYALGLTWYRFLIGKDVVENTFCDFDEEVSAQQIAIAKKSVSEIAKAYGI